MDDFYAARSRIIPPLPWQTFSPPFSDHTSLSPDVIVETGIPVVRLFWTKQSTPAAPLVYEAGLVQVLSGWKNG